MLDAETTLKLLLDMQTFQPLFLSTLLPFHPFYIINKHWKWTLNGPPVLFGRSPNKQEIMLALFIYEVCVVDLFAAHMYVYDVCMIMTLNSIKMNKRSYHLMYDLLCVIYISLHIQTKTYTPNITFILFLFFFYKPYKKALLQLAIISHTQYCTSFSSPGTVVVALNTNPLPHHYTAIHHWMSLYQWQYIPKSHCNANV